MSRKIIRFVKETDTAEILSIYKPYIIETAITFECEIPSLNEFAERIKGISFDYPYIVCLIDNKIIGYAYAHRQMERDAYQWNSELSVYIDKNHLRCGIGKVLYNSLIEILQLQNICNIYGGVTVPNENSEKLHEHLGFEKLGTYHNTGYKCGVWHDVAWFEKKIGRNDPKPAPFASIREIEKIKLDEIISKYTKKING
ncbi:GNAT family N-acetyltransferase [Anaerovorax odorimutans]|uniref:GNAT family N-acetyltransferase n=1 Tax=Anaerovorax odorimutans TaxID=109327 RepID=UPI000428A010|nr:GNAT family N-acetyltransferase [Anaerovorax odorimutans]